MIQLSRTESLFRQLLLKLNFSIPVYASVIFINPEFTLYNAPMEKPYIFSGQIKNFINKINSQHTQLTIQHKKLAEKLLSLHLKVNPYQNLPAYDHQHIKKGINCPKCNSFSILIKGWKCYCSDCRNFELVEKAIVRNVNDFRLLFPNEKVTTNKISDWCKIISSKQRLQRTLKKNFNHFGKQQWSYYE